MKPYISHAGYTAAVSAVIFSYALVLMKIEGVILNISYQMLFSMVLTVFLLMLLGEYVMKKSYNSKNNISVKYKALSTSNKYMLRSTFFRFISLSVPLAAASGIVMTTPYFTQIPIFAPTILFFKYVLILFVVLAPLYIFLTLKFRGDSRYEFNDYALLTLIGLKSLGRLVSSKKQTYRPYANRRVKKVFLVYLVNFFFITLMVRYLPQEFYGFEQNFTQMFSEGYFGSHWHKQARDIYFVLFHTLFIIDVTIGIIGYASASRWLGNRTRSVDVTISGWFVALFCYPPFNQFFYTYFLPYDNYQTFALVTSNWARTVVFVLLILLYALYVWGTITLGFKFSNLTNRGIVSHGPYKYVRHPAYISKNLAWLIDYTHIFSNIWAALTFFGWNAIYILRGLTEERHLNHDKAYLAYKKKVRYMFIPKVI